MSAAVAAPADTFFFARFSALLAETPLAPGIPRRITLHALVFLPLQLGYHAALDITALCFREISISKLFLNPIDHFFLFLLRNL